MKVAKVVKKCIRFVDHLESSRPTFIGVGQRLNKEILVWQKIDHENIIPLLGITFDFGRDGPMGMVCPWLENGNLNGYLDRCGAALALCGRFRIVSSGHHFFRYGN